MFLIFLLSFPTSNSRGYFISSFTNSSPTPIVLKLPGCPAKKDFCSNAVCVNGGVCVSKWNTHSCECPTGYGGKNCEQGKKCVLFSLFSLNRRKWRVRAKTCHKVEKVDVYCMCVHIHAGVSAVPKSVSPLVCFCTGTFVYLLHVCQEHIQGNVWDQMRREAAPLSHRWKVAVAEHDLRFGV